MSSGDRPGGLVEVGATILPEQLLEDGKVLRVGGGKGEGQHVNAFLRPLLAEGDVISPSGWQLGVMLIKDVLAVEQTERAGIPREGKHIALGVRDFGNLVGREVFSKGGQSLCYVEQAADVNEVLHLGAVDGDDVGGAAAGCQCHCQFLVGVLPGQSRKFEGHFGILSGE